MLKLHFAPASRAERVLWLLEELELPYELNSMPFHPEALKSDVSIYESGAIIDYVLEKHKNGGLKPSVDSPEYPYYLQWFHFCEGMVMPPMNQIVVQTVLLPPDRRDETVLNQAKNLLSKSLSPVNDFLDGKDYLIGEFSAADCMLGHSCYMANKLGCVSEDMVNIKKYVSNIEAREAFQKAIKLGDEAGNPIG